MTGHLLGAAGGLEAGITALAVKHQMIPPTINYENPDPECDLDYVPNTRRGEATIEYALSNSFGFGGTNGALLFKRSTGSQASTRARNAQGELTAGSKVAANCSTCTALELDSGSWEPGSW